ncbi:MAG TPA: SPOR domain-containing protein [Pyrinomonadaceae bacterium]|nr:SPOR domain-containing protein [Pyrinomonadaceae bacterium]
MDAKHEEVIIEGSVDEEAVVAAEDEQSVVAQAPTLAPYASDSSAPDTYAVGIHVMKMAPAWLLTTSVFFVLLILLLSWVRPDASASGTASSASNDSKAHAATPGVIPAPVAPNGEQQVAEVAPVAEGVGDKAVPSEAPTPAEPASQTSTSPAESHPVAAVPEEPSVAGASNKQANASSDSEPKFTVQVSSHSDESGANEQVSRVRAAGFDAWTVAVELPGRGKWYRVQSGSFDDRAGASKEAALLRAKGVAPAGIVVPRQ